MKKKVIFLVLVVFTAILFLASCESILPDPEEELTEDGLFLKSAWEDEMTSIFYIDDGEGGEFYFPNNLLFEIKEGEARVFNSLLMIEDYHVFSNNEQAVFRMIEAGAKPIVMGEIAGRVMYSPHYENIVAFRLPFTRDDFDCPQAESQKCSGLLKAGVYVLAIKENQVMVYNLDSEEVIKSEGIFSGDSFIFTVNSDNSEVWTLTFVTQSPIGNIFTLTIGEEETDCYTLMR
jgi:hypothetical protein